MKNTKLVALSVLALLTLSSCSRLRSPTFWDAAQAACKAALTSKPEVQAEASARGLTVNEWAAVLCSLTDVIEPFVVEKDTSAATAKSMVVVRERGLVR